MNQTAVVDGRRYQLLDIVPSLTDQTRYVLGEDAN